MVSPDVSGFHVIHPHPRAMTVETARDLLYLAAELRRFHNVLDACGGDLEQAGRVWREVGRQELALYGRRRLA